jgi:hypothetical protein
VSRFRSDARALVALAAAGVCAAMVPATGLCARPGAAGYDYPTLDRVQFVGECMQRHADVDRQEMIYKCSCAMDRIRKQMTYDDFVESSTAAKASTLAGERGNLIRDTDAGMKLVKRYRKVEGEAFEACFIKAP